MTGVLDRQLPHTADAERAVLGAVLIHNAAFWRLTDLQVTDFFKEPHRTIYGCMKRLASTGREIDLLSLKDELGAQLDEVGGSAYVSSLVDGIPDVANVEAYARMVVEKSKLRRLVVAGNSMMRAAMDQEVSPEEIAADAMRDLTNLATRPDLQARPLAEVIRETYVELEQQMNGVRTSRLTTAFAMLDACRAIRRTSIVIGAPSKDGKTGFAINLAEQLAQHEHKVVMFSLESSEKETALRYVSTVGQIGHSRVQDWKTLHQSEWPKLAVAESTAQKRAIFLARHVRTIDGIYAECRRIQAVHGLDAAFVDYIQLVRMPGGPRDREERIAMISQTMLEIATDLDIAMIATSQVNKEWRERKSGRLYVSDLKYAAAIGESARVVLLFHRPHMIDKDRGIPPCLVKFQVEANNENVTNDYDFHFDEITQTFREGTCAQNNCRRLSAGDRENSLFNAKENR